MANLFGQLIKDTYQSLVTLGSGNTLTDGTGSLITSLDVSASFATTATSASYASTATSASHALVADVALNVPSFNTGSLMVTGSVTDNVLTFEKGDGSTFNLTVDTGSASSDLTALSSSLSTRLTVDEGLISGNAAAIIINSNDIASLTAATSSYVTNAQTSSMSVLNAVSASIANSATTALLATTASYAVTASYAANVSTPTLQQVTTAGSSSVDMIEVAGVRGTYLISAGQLDLGSLSGDTNIISVGGDITLNGLAYPGADGSAGEVLKTDGAGTLSFTNTIATASNADLLDGLDSTEFAILANNNTFSGNQTFNDITVNGTGSFAYIQSVTGSAKIIGDAFIILNNDTPAERYAGIVVQDSGSGAPNTTASFFFDGSTNDWNYEYSNDGGATVDLGVALFGPEYNTKGSPVYLTMDRIPKGEGHHHLVDSSISDNGSLVSIGNPVNVTGQVSASSYIGDGSGLTGISSGLVAGTGTDAMASSDALTTTPATASGDYSVALGENARGTQNSAVAIGKDSYTQGYEAVAIGGRAEAEQFGSVALGGGVKSTGTLAIGIGNSVASKGSFGIVIGVNSEAETGQNQVAIGYDTKNYANDSISIGRLTYISSSNASSIAIGHGITTSGANEILIGSASVSNGANTVTLGNSDITDTYLFGTIHGDGSAITGVVSASYAVTASYALNAAAGGGEATPESGNILFENIYGEIYGSAVSPLTGNITIDGASTKVDGATAIIYHNDSTEPTISGAIVDKKSGTYGTGSLNIITLTNIDGSHVLEYVAGIAATGTPALSVEESGTPVTTATEAINFNGSEFTVADNPSNTAEVVIGGASFTGVTSVAFDNAIANVYNTAASPATGNITLTGTGAKKGGTAVIYHNDSTAPTISGLTVDKTFGVYSESNLNIITVLYTGANVIVSIAGISPAVEGSAESGDLLFENQIGEIYGTSGTPLTGNITISASSTKVIGASAILYHEDGTEPTVSGGTVVKKVGSYDTGGLNMISFVYLGSGEYIQAIAGADVTGIITNSADTYTSTAKVQSIVTCTAAEYSGLTPDANTFYIVI